MGWRRKSQKYGADFVELINQYVIDNEILRQTIWLLNRQELSQRLYIIQNVDRKLSLDDIAKAKVDHGGLT
jgi:ATP-dependent DNA helicase RecQ